MDAEAVQLEKQHVHSVYEKTAPYLSDLQCRAWPRVRQFLLQQEPGSLVADIGCGTGRYLQVNSGVFSVGCDVCRPLVDRARKRGSEVLLCDNLRLPFRDGIFSAVISVGVIHHFSTSERRGCAVREMARTLAPGGLMLIYVWAQEQRHRRFDKQDVFVPWNQALCSGGPGGPGLGSCAAAPAGREGLLGRALRSWRLDGAGAEPGRGRAEAPAARREGATELMRYYHVFKEGELARLVADNVPELHIQSTFLDHGNWGVLARKQSRPELPPCAV
ncbi:probable tRNA methyltransferase 9B isoform X2 [Lepisosteus oculatus]